MQLLDLKHNLNTTPQLPLCVHLIAKYTKLGLPGIPAPKPSPPLERLSHLPLTCGFWHVIAALAIALFSKNSKTRRWYTQVCSPKNSKTRRGLSRHPWTSRRTSKVFFASLNPRGFAVGKIVQTNLSPLPVERSPFEWPFWTGQGHLILLLPSGEAEPPGSLTREKPYQVHVPYKYKYQAASS